MGRLHKESLFIRVLRFIASKEQVNVKEIKRSFRMKHDEELDRVLNELSGRDNHWLIKFINTNRKSKDGHWYQITMAGFEYLNKVNGQNLAREQNEILKRQQQSLRAQIAVTIILIAATLWIGINSNAISNRQADISERQTEILEKTSVPYEPNLVMTIDQRDLVFPAWGMVRSHDINAEAKNRWAQIDLYLHNFGLSDSGRVFCDASISDPAFFVYLNPGNNFQNIVFGQTESLNLHIAHKDCTNKLDMEACDKPELVPIGNHKVNISCHYRGGGNLTRIFDICIYNEQKDTC